MFLIFGDEAPIIHTPEWLKNSVVALAYVFMNIIQAVGNDKIYGRFQT